MLRANTLINLIGQIRIYSLVDLIVLMIAIQATSFQLGGAILLHIGFLLFLEHIHRHRYRASFPRYLWILITVIGIYLYRSFFVVGFLLCSFLYTQKNHPSFSPYSSFFRGLQCYFLTAGVLGA